MSSKSCQKYRPLLNSLEIISIKQQNVYSTTLLRHSLLINSFHMQSLWIKCSQFVHPEVLTFFLVVWITEIYKFHLHVRKWAIMATIRKIVQSAFPERIIFYLPHRISGLTEALDIDWSAPCFLYTLHVIK